jgi:hypothetical protein
MRHPAAVFLLALAPACASAPPPHAAPIERAAAIQAIAHALDDFHDAAARADEARYFAHFAPEGVFLGTDGTERWDVPAFRTFAHPFFARGKAWSFHAVRRAITVGDDGRFAYFDEDLATEKLGPARGSGVLVREDVHGDWKIAQYNLATVIPNDRFAEVRALLEGPKPASKTEREEQNRADAGRGGEKPATR